MDINTLYDDAYAKALAATQNQPTYTGNAYNDLKQQVAQNQALASDNLKKRMNDIGAGQSLTVQNNAQMASLNNSGNVDRQQQAYTGYQNILNQQTQANAEAQRAQIYANNYASQTNALINDENNKFSTYYNLYLKRKMTAKQFKALTGIDAKTVSTGSGVSGGDPTSNINKIMEELNAPYSNSTSPSGEKINIGTNSGLGYSYGTLPNNKYIIAQQVNDGLLKIQKNGDGTITILPAK